VHPKAAFTIQEKLWRYPGEAAWYFIRLDKKTSDEIARIAVKGGWGSVKVSATIGKTIWTTSLFPDKGSGYLLPVKASVRKKETLQDGDSPLVTLSLL
jgi:hypothetical protein